MRLSRVVWYNKLDNEIMQKATKKLNECTCTQKIGKEWNFERLSQVATLQEEEVVTLQEKEETALQEKKEATTEGASSYCGNLEEAPGHLPDLISDLSMIKFFELE